VLHRICAERNFGLVPPPLKRIAPLVYPLASFNHSCLLGDRSHARYGEPNDTLSGRKLSTNRGGCSEPYELRFWEARGGRHFGVLWKDLSVWERKEGTGQERARGRWRRCRESEKELDAYLRREEENDGRGSVWLGRSASRCVFHDGGILLPIPVSRIHRIHLTRNTTRALLDVDDSKHSTSHHTIRSRSMNPPFLLCPSPYPQALWALASPSRS
jgi:hypothetical protein